MGTFIDSNLPPREVLVEFLHALGQTVHSGDQIVPVLRGSTLLQYWFGADARPAADIDLEWFPDADRRSAVPMPIEHARRLCMHTVSNHGYEVDGSGHQVSVPIAFDGDVPVPDDGVNLSLWEYDTPGVRCYAGWRWDERQLTGALQIDIAEAGSYELASISTETIELPRPWGEPARVLAYTQEMLLAAKLSWIVRHVQFQSTPQGEVLTFDGMPKDVFDAGLLLTRGSIRSEVFQGAFLAVAAEDKLDWGLIDDLLDPELAPAEDPALQTVIENVRPLLGDLREHLPFLETVEDEVTDEANLLVYADWLEERGDPRGDFLRQFCQFYFHEDRSARARAASLLPAQPVGWLCHVFGGPERMRYLRQRIETTDEVAKLQPAPGNTTTSDQPTSPERPWWRFW